MLLRDKLPAGFIVPAQPVERAAPPTGADWVHEIKHDGYRMLVRRDGGHVRLFSRKAVDWTARLPAVVERVRAALLTLTDQGRAALAALLKNGNPT
jgi:ATP-dependent DNA ligase